MRITAITAMLLAGTVTAHAGDYDAPAETPEVTPAAPAQQATSWAGFYAGLSYSAVSGSIEENTLGSNFPDLDGDGAPGFFIGYNWQRDNLVFGAEVNHTAVETNYVGFANSIQEDVTELRGRVGYTPQDKLLVYGFLGYAESTLDDTGAILDYSGVSYGVGVDYKVWNNMFVGLELARRDMEDSSPGGTIGSEIDTISLRVGYKF